MIWSGTFWGGRLEQVECEQTTQEQHHDGSTKHGQKKEKNTQTLKTNAKRAIRIVTRNNKISMSNRECNWSLRDIWELWDLGFFLFLRL